MGEESIIICVLKTLKNYSWHVCTNVLNSVYITNTSQNGDIEFQKDAT